MFKALLESAGNFIKIIDALATIIDVATFNMSEAGLSVKAMDPSHVVMVNLELPSKGFTEYECDASIPIRINLTDLNRFMKRGSAGDSLALSLDQKNNKLKLKFKQPKSTRTFSLSLISEEEEEEIPSPKLDFNATFSLNTNDLQRAIKDAQIVGDYITFTISADTLTLDATGDTGDVTIEVEELKELSIKGQQNSMYSLEYLADIIKASSVSDLVTVEFSTEMPIKFNFPIREQEGQITYLLAPRVEEEEDYEDIGEEETEFEESINDDEE